MSENGVSCTYCQDEIPYMYIRCVDCEDYISCVLCFSLGAEIGSHKNSHRYKFENTSETLVVSESGWNLREELTMLDAIENFGYGNWEHIASVVETRTAEEVKEEYENMFLNGPIGRTLWVPAREKRPTLIDQTVEDDGPLGPKAMSQLPPLDVTPEEATSLGYMPLRDDYEKEYNNTAELLVSSLVINDDTDELDTALKLAHVDMYMHSLRERARRKRMCRDYQIAAQFFQRRKERSTHRRKRTKQDKELEDKFRRFAQFSTAKEHEQFISNLRREQELIRRFKELCKYRENGITTFAECAEFNRLHSTKQPTPIASDSGASLPNFQPCQKEEEEKSEDCDSIEKKSTSCTELQPTSPHSTDNLPDPNPAYIDDCYRLLTQSEIEFCEKNNYSLPEYIKSKTLLIMDGPSADNTPEMDEIQSFMAELNWL